MNTKTAYQATILLRKATAADFKEEQWYLREDNTGAYKHVLKIGQPFWVRSQQTGVFDNNAQILTEDTNLEDIKTWLQHDMLYVPIGSLSVDEYTITNN